ncbi:DNA replication initiation factor cdc45 [Cryptotrichosporon argae]
MPVLVPPGPDTRPSDLSYLDAYNSIVSRVRRRGGSGSNGLVIFAGVDLDGLLGARILASLFRQDDIPYRLIPIGGLSELRAKRDELLQPDAENESRADEIHTLVLLSLGSLLDIPDEFPLPPSCHLHVIDAHRPWNLTNLFGADLTYDNETDRRYWVWGDGDEAKLGREKQSWEALEFEPQDSASNDEDEDEDEDDEEADEGEADEDDEDDEEDENGERRPRGKRKQNGSAGPSKRPRRLNEHAHAAHVDQIQRYYAAGTSYGLSVAQTVYHLAAVLERADNDVLWLAILALTHQYTAARIDLETYEEHHAILLDEVARLNVEPEPGAKAAPDPDDRKVARSEEMRFMLFRHWNLYDAMLHSGYVASHMGIWKEKGRKRLQGLLAKMGYSLQQSQQPYAHMDMTLRRDLPDKLDSIAPEYGITELFYPSFTRAFGFQLSLSAADAVEGLCALLEAAKGVKLEVEVEGGRGGGEWFGGTRTWSIDARDGVNTDKSRDREREREQENGDTQVQRKEQAWHVANFWVAYDACDDVALLRKSLPLAMALHRSIIRQGSSILDKAIIRPLRHFRFAAISEGPDVRLFAHPATLGRLALWLVDAYRDRWAEKDARDGKPPKSLPFVVACLNQDTDRFLVVGVTGAPEFGDVRKNKFGLAFQEAADESGATYTLDMFDTSIVEVENDHLTRFVESIQIRAA